MFGKSNLRRRVTGSSEEVTTEVVGPRAWREVARTDKQEGKVDEKGNLSAEETRRI